MKRASMAQALSVAAGKATAGVEIKAQAEGTVLHRLRAVAPSREGKKPIAGFFAPEASRQLKKLGLEQDKTVQELVRESLNDLFLKYDLPPIA